MATGNTAAKKQSDDGADPRAQHIGKVYAKALLGAADKAGQAEGVLSEFDSLIADLLNVFPRWEQVLSSALIPPEEKQAMLDRTLGGKASQLLLNFLKVLAQHGRLDCLRPIHRALHDLYNQSRRRVAVYVRSATPLPPDQAAQLAAAVRSRLNMEPELLSEIDPELIGGMIVRVGDTVFDGSISSELERMRVQMINRSVHEIQSRRDRFRNPSGN